MEPLLAAIAGTSNVTTYVESAAGIGAGGRTGLTALVVAICFAVSSFFSPLLAIVPNAATAPILIIVGIMMLASLKNIHWDDMAEAIPAFFTSIFMGFAYSITSRDSSWVYHLHFGQNLQRSSQGCAFYDLDFGSSLYFEFRKSGFKLGLNIAGFPCV